MNERLGERTATDVPVGSYFNVISEPELREKTVTYLVARSITRPPHPHADWTPPDLESVRHTSVVKARKLVAEYRGLVSDVTKYFTEIREKTRQVLHDLDLHPPRGLADVRIAVNDIDLTKALGKESIIELPHYDPFSETIVVSKYRSAPHIIAHELFHHLAHGKDSLRVGFRAIAPDELMEHRFGGNGWLDEGATMIGERLVAGEHEIDHIYEQYKWLTKEFLAAISWNEARLLRAYFGQEPDRSDLERAAQKRFGCSVADLGALFLGFYEGATDDMRRLLAAHRNDRVIVHCSQESLERLRKVFPRAERA